jgi:hypothetical protein
VSSVVDWYLGPAGRLQLLRPPRRDYERTADPSATTYGLLSGGSAVDRAANVSRKFAYSWQWLPPEQWAVLTALHTRQYGAGPFTLIDGGTRNYLSPNQASGCTTLRDTTDFALAAIDDSESLSVATTPTDVGDRSLSWMLPANPTYGILRFTAPSPTKRTYLATPPGLQWPAWVRVWANNPVTGRLRLSWRSSTGAQLSTSDGPDTVLPASPWGALPVIGTAPPNAWYVEPQLVLDNASVTSPTIVSLGSGRLMLGGFDPAWAPGEGMPLVSVTSLSETVPLFDRRSPTITLQEVG